MQKSTFAPCKIGYRRAPPPACGRLYYPIAVTRNCIWDQSPKVPNYSPAAVASTTAGAAAAGGGAACAVAAGQPAGRAGSGAAGSGVAGGGGAAGGAAAGRLGGETSRDFVTFRFGYFFLCSRWKLQNSLLRLCRISHVGRKSTFHAAKVDFCTFWVPLLHFRTLVVSPDLRYGCTVNAVVKCSAVSVVAECARSAVLLL